MRFQLFYIGFCFLNTAVCFADDLPSYERSAVRRYQSGLESMLGKAERDFRRLQESLVRKQEVAKHNGDVKTVEAITLELSALSQQLQQLRGVLSGGAGKDLEVGKGQKVAEGNEPVGLAGDGNNASDVLRVVATDEIGTALGPLPKGSVVVLQYQGGVWSGGTTHGTASPDSTSNPVNLLCIAGTSPDGALRNAVLARVPTNTAVTPFRFIVEHDCAMVTLRIGDEKGWFHDNQGTVTYRVAVSKTP